MKREKLIEDLEYNYNLTNQPLDLLSLDYHTLDKICLSMKRIIIDNFSSMLQEKTVTSQRKLGLIEGMLLMYGTFSSILGEIKPLDRNMKKQVKSALNSFLNDIKIDEHFKKEDKNSEI